VLLHKQQMYIHRHQAEAIVNPQNRPKRDRKGVFDQ